MRIVGIDYGTARIGLAVSDERRIIASPLATVQAAKTPQKSAELVAAALAKQPGISEIVIGLPLLLNGTESPMCAQVRIFAQALSQLLPFPITFSDERLTTAYTERTLKDLSMKRKARAGVIDAAAACTILENHLMKVKT
jgi:putative Holliday junction resolvase